jgi:hypothetical protein
MTKNYLLEESTYPWPSYEAMMKNYVANLICRKKDLNAISLKNLLCNMLL